jgi:hypothetical protein
LRNLPTGIESRVEGMTHQLHALLTSLQDAMAVQQTGEGSRGARLWSNRRIKLFRTLVTVLAPSDPSVCSLALDFLVYMRLEPLCGGGERRLYMLATRVGLEGTVG